MNYLKLFEDFDSENKVAIYKANKEYCDNLTGIAEDVLSDLKDEGFEVNVGTDDLPASEGGFLLYVTISKNNTTTNKQGQSYKNPIGFNIDDIKDSVNELLAQLDTQKPYDVSYHIKGYETHTWYSVSNIPDNLKDISLLEIEIGDQEKLDKISIEFRHI